MKYQIVPVTPFAQNCSVVWCEVTGKAAVIDPGGDVNKIEKVIEENNLRVEKVLLTHAHIDHAGATADIAEKYQVPIEGPHKGDEFWINMLPQQSQMFGFPQAKPFEPTRWLEGGDTVTVGETVFDVLHCPGHTPGHVVFYQENEQLAFVGDVLFQGSIGRTDFPQGNHGQLIRSIKEQLWPLGDDTAFVPGHGPMSTFGAERRSNPFVADGT